MGHKIGQENRTKKIGQKIGHDKINRKKMRQKNRIKRIGHVEVGQKKSDIENRIIIGDEIGQKNRKKVGQKNRAKIGHEIGQKIGHINRHE